MQIAISAVLTIKNIGRQQKFAVTYREC